MSEIEKQKDVVKEASCDDFSKVCKKYNVVDLAVKRLLEIAEDNFIEPSQKADIYMFLLEMNSKKTKL